jgi:GT2 family glycosyltransferase
VFPLESNPLVSIAIVTWNRKEELSKAIASCRRQTYKNIEFVVVDNDSSDGTYNYLLKEHPDIKAIKTHKNIFTCPGRNIALASCTGDFIISLDDDASLDEECIEQIVRNHQENEEVAIVACNVLDPSDIGNRGGKDFADATSQVVPIFMPGACGIRRTVLDDVGYFPDYSRQGEENYLALKILDAGYKILFEPTAVVYHEWIYGDKGRNERQILYLNFRHDLENLKRLLPFRYALPLMVYKIFTNLVKRYLSGARLRYFFPDLVKVLPILATNYREKKIKFNTYRWFTREASKYFKDRNSYKATTPPSE